MKKIFLTGFLVACFSSTTFVGSVYALSLSDMQLNGQNADAMSGVVEGNDTDGIMNTYFAGNEFSFIAKDDPPGGTSGSGSLGGVNFSILASGTGTKTSTGVVGTWDLTWGGSGFPVAIDLVAVLKASDRYVAFFFDNEMFSAPGTNSPDDNWKITFVNSGGQFPELSHLSLYGRDVTPTNPVPEPATMLLFGAGLIGLAGVARRKVQ